jgi:hypothetical protein
VAEVRDGERTTYHPAFYRVSFGTAAGLVWRDVRTLEEARREAKRQASPGWDYPQIRACWNVQGRPYIDSEPVR